MGNSSDEDKISSSNSPLQGSTEPVCDLSTADSANIHIDNDVPGISESHNREIAPSGGNLMTTSSQRNQSLLNRPHSRVLNPNAALFTPSPRSRVGNIYQPPLDIIHFGMPVFGVPPFRVRVPPGSIPLNPYPFTPRPVWWHPPYLPSNQNLQSSSSNLVMRNMTSQATVSTFRPPISTRARIASSAPSTSQTIPPQILCCICGNDLASLLIHPTLRCNHSYCWKCLEFNVGCIACYLDLACELYR